MQPEQIMKLHPLLKEMNPHLFPGLFQGELHALSCKPEVEPLGRGSKVNYHTIPAPCGWGALLRRFLQVCPKRRRTLIAHRLFHKDVSRTHFFTVVTFVQAISHAHHGSLKIKPSIEAF